MKQAQFLSEFLASVQRTPGNSRQDIMANLTKLSMARTLTVQLVRRGALARFGVVPCLFRLAVSPRFLLCTPRAIPSPAPRHSRSPRARRGGLVKGD